MALAEAALGATGLPRAAVTSAILGAVSIILAAASGIGASAVLDLAFMDTRVGPTTITVTAAARSLLPMAIPGLATTDV